MKKVLRDIASTLYDDLDFKCLSLPRLLVAVGFFVVMTAWIMEQFFCKPCPHFPELCGFFGGGSLVNFAWSKWTDLRDPLIKRLNEVKDDGQGQ